MTTRDNGFPAGGLIRAARRRADLGQHALAIRAAVSQSTVSRAEAGGLTPSLAVLCRLLAVADLELVVVDRDNRLVRPMITWDDTRDGADRRFPAHLDTILDPRMGEWWGDRYGLARPPETFHRDGRRRDAQRIRSRWETRVAQYRAVPEPPTVPDGRPGRFG